MKASRDTGQLVMLLEELGILSSPFLEELRWQATVRTNEVDTILSELVDQQAITRFQQSKIQQGEARSLRLGNYVLLEQIGAGGMGVVYKARHLKMNRVVALKTLNYERGNGILNCRRFRREILMAARLSHPNIVTAHDADDVDGQPFLVMEFIEGLNFAEWYRAEGPLPISEVVDAVSQAAAGLQLAHDRGTIHRDVKPANLIRTREGIVKILDLGLARISRSSGTASESVGEYLTQASMIAGTPAFIAPEQALESEVDGRADVYSLGCTLWFLLCGDSPYTASSPPQMLDAHRFSPIPQVAAVRSDAPSGLQKVIDQMLAKSREDRFSSMNDVIAALEDLKPQIHETVGLSLDGRSTSDVCQFPVRTQPVQEPRLPSPGVRGPSCVPRTASRMIQVAALPGGLMILLLAVAGIILRIRTPDGEVTVESASDTLNVAMTSERSFQIEDPNGTSIMAGSTSGDGILATTGHVSVVTRDLTINQGLPDQLRVRMTAPGDGSRKSLDPTTAAEPPEQRLQLLAQSNPELASWITRLETDRNDAEALAMRGQYLSDLSEWELARQDLKRVTELQPGNAAAWASLAHTLEECRRMPEAQGAWNKATELKPSDANYRVRHGLVLMKLSRTDEALADMTHAIKLSPGSSYVWVNRAHVLVALQRHEDALSDLTRATTADSLNTTGWIMRAQFYRDQGNYEAADSDYGEAIRREPHQAAWYAGRAICRRQLQRVDEAIADFEEAARLNPGAPYLLHDLAMTCLSFNRRDQAVAAFVQLKRKFPDSEVPDFVQAEVHEKFEQLNQPDSHPE